MKFFVILILGFLSGCASLQSKSLLVNIDSDVSIVGYVTDVQKEEVLEAGEVVNWRIVTMKLYAYPSEYYEYPSEIPKPGNISFIDTRFDISDRSSSVFQACNFSKNDRELYFIMLKQHKKSENLIDDVRFTMISCVEIKKTNSVGIPF